MSADGKVAPWDAVPDALRFFRSSLQSGEPWTETCQWAYDQAIAAVVRLEQRAETAERALAAWREYAQHMESCPQSYSEPCAKCAEVGTAAWRTVVVEVAAAARPGPQP